MRSITVAGRCPLRKACMAATIVPTSCPASRGTGVSTFTPAGWHPEHDTAPGGASAACAGSTPAQLSTAERTAAAPTAAPGARSAKGQTVVLEGEAAIALAGRRRDGVEHGGRGDADGRLTDAAPHAAVGRHHDRLNLRHLADAHHVVAVEVGLNDGAVLDCAFAE